MDFAQAGMRTYLHEQLLETLEVLALDYLGNRDPLLEIDELRRGTGKGLAVATELAARVIPSTALKNLIIPRPERIRSEAWIGGSRVTPLRPSPAKRGRYCSSIAATIRASSPSLCA